jgi:hypothetical protein
MNQWKLLNLAGATIVMIAANVEAAPVSILGGAQGTFHFLDNVSANSFNFPSGVRQTMGALDVSAASGSVSGTAYQPCGSNQFCLNDPRTSILPVPNPNGPPTLAPVLALPLNNNNFTVAPNFIGASPSAGLAPNGQWLLSFSNNSGGTSNTATELTPTIQGASVLSHPTNVSISGSGNAPTFTWTLPQNAGNIDAIRVQLWDHQRTVGIGSAGVGGAGIADVIYVSDKIPLSQTSFSLPVDAQGLIAQTLMPDGNPAPQTKLQLNGLYSLEISMLDLRNPNGDVSLPNILSRTRSIFDFTFLKQGDPAKVFLPNVNLQGPAPIFEFQPINVQAGQQIFIDPLLAVGYDYQIGAGNPNFKTVMLPTGIGDGWYEIYMWDNGGWIKLADIEGGKKYDFGLNGLDRFRVLGIEPSAGLDPNDPIAFITGLEFVGDGIFDGTMKAVVANVPEPESMVLFGLALGLLALFRRGRSALQ